MTVLLEVEHLSIALTGDQSTPLVRDVSFQVDRGELVALVGESGSGKSLTALALLGLLPGSMRLAPESRIALDGEPIAGIPDTALRGIRGNRIGMIFQDPFASLNPVLTIGSQVIEAIRAHSDVTRGEARAIAIKLLDEVGIPDPSTRIDAWPHQLSGGMRQRVMIAIALAAGPDLLIADEPTTALDATIQSQILQLLIHLRQSRGLAILLISHDLGMVRGHADRIMVMHQGAVVESGPATQLFAEPTHPHTRSLLAAMPDISHGPPARVVATNPLLIASNLVKEYPLRRRSSSGARTIRALDDVSIGLAPGEILGLVGESGSGKSTLGRVLLRLEDPDSGRIEFAGNEITSLDGEPLRALRRRMQLVFQDAAGSLNPRRTVSEAIAEGLIIHGLASATELADRVMSLMDEVGLDHGLAGRRPHQLSGGQRQRVGIARALAVDPELLVADESVSSLDATVQAQIIELLLALRESRGLACLFIAHDLAVVRRLADRIAVMRGGKVLEVGPAGAVIESPQHPYTVELIEAARSCLSWPTVAFPRQA